MNVYLIRHTEVDMAEPLCYGQTDMPVREDVFAEEAEQARRALAGIQFDHVFCSPLQRAVRLADYCGYPDAERDDRLKELFMGDYEMVPFRFIPQEHLDLWFRGTETETIQKRSRFLPRLRYTLCPHLGGPTALVGRI